MNHHPSYPLLVVQSTALFTQSGVLDQSRQSFSPNGCASSTHFYEAFQVNVALSGHYTFTSNRTVSTYGHLYEHAFYPFDPSQNQIAVNHSGCSNWQFMIRHLLRANTTYTLVLSTDKSSDPDPFTIMALGEASISFTPISKHECVFIRNTAGYLNRYVVTA